MKLLALDTATEACSAALWQDGDVTERYEVIGTGHAARLLPMAQELLAGAQVGVGALAAIAFGRGPGGFTGLRIAAGIAQGLAFGAGLPVVPVSDLAALALAGARASGRSRVLACLDARMGQVYWAAFDVAGERVLALTSETLAAPENVELPGTDAWFGAGHGLSAYPQIATRLGGRLAAADATLLPRAGDVARLAVTAFRAGEALPAGQAVPRYLRDEVVHRR